MKYKISEKEIYQAVGEWMQRTKSIESAGVRMTIIADRKGRSDFGEFYIEAEEIDRKDNR